MDFSGRLSAAFPDRPPTWLDVVIGVALVGAVIPQLLSSSISWLPVAVGFGAFAIAIGPASTTGIGRRIGRWFRRIGVAGRAAVVGLYALLAGVAAHLKLLPVGLAAEFALGGLVACLLFLIAFIAQAGTVSGWLSTEY